MTRKEILEKMLTHLTDEGRFLSTGNKNEDLLALALTLALDLLVDAYWTGYSVALGDHDIMGKINDENPGLSDLVQMG